MKQKIDIIRRTETVEYPNGNKCDFYVICDICRRSNYPIFRWRTADDPYIGACICFECVNDMIIQDAT